jgi:hypothetical protein
MELPSGTARFAHPSAREYACGVCSFSYLWRVRVVISYGCPQRIWFLCMFNEVLDKKIGWMNIMAGDLLCFHISESNVFCVFLRVIKKEETKYGKNVL